MTNITKKQYILSSCQLDLTDMQEHKVSECFLYTHKDLNVSIVKNADGETVFLLGNAFCTDIYEKQAEKDIEASHRESIEKATSFWTGRWVIVTATEIFTDASGLMGAFYGYQNDTWFVSSSLALISKITKKQPECQVKSDGISWRILPDSIISNVNTLICTQKLVFSKDGLKVLPKIWINDYRHYSTEQKCQAVSEMLMIGSKNIAKYSEKQVLLALTGGKDSRLVFSALLKSGVPFSTYTAEHSNISSADKTVPKKLSKIFGIDHNYIKANPPQNELRTNYNNFCCGNTNGADAQFYARGQFSRFSKDTIIIRSGIFEAAQTYARSYTSAEIDGFVRGMTNYYSDLQKPSSQNISFEKWLKITVQNPIPHIDIRDRFYIEQRVGGWVSAIEQSLDINEFTSIQVANCAELLSILLSCNEEERNTLAISYGTIKLLEPKVLDIPINQKSISDKFKRIKSIIKNPIKKLKHYLNKSRR